MVRLCLFFKGAYVPVKLTIKYLNQKKQTHGDGLCSQYFFRNISIWFVCQVQIHVSSFLSEGNEPCITRQEDRHHSYHHNHISFIQTNNYVMLGLDSKRQRAKLNSQSHQINSNKSHKIHSNKQSCEDGLGYGN